ncbi:MAG: hypothetical protein H8D23_39915 [Candidatus Brocadiales bacterium]|nr:hypothetical protein [Candidatus Brocadiales bacterium]
MVNEFNLSDQNIVVDVGYRGCIVFKAEDVKEFIKRLKEELAAPVTLHEDDIDRLVTNGKTVMEDIIDKLAGERLI